MQDSLYSGLMLQNVDSINNGRGEGTEGSRIIVCSSIVECISACIPVLINKKEIIREVVIDVTREEAIRVTLDYVKEISVDGGVGKQKKGLELSSGVET